MISKIKGIFNSDDLKAKFTRGGLLLAVGAFIENGARFFRNIILTRILAPEYFGLMATIIAIITTFQAVTEVGVRQAIIHNKKGSFDDFLNVAWWFSFFRGILLFALAILTAPLICKFFNSPNLLLPLKVTYLVLLFNGIVSPRIHVLEKELKYFHWVIILQGSALFGVIVSIITSIFIRNIWPLVVGFTTEYVLICILSYIFVPFKPKLLIEKLCLKELLKYARGMFGLPILTAIFQRIDIFAIGKLLTMGELGLYSIAQNLAYAPNILFTKIVRPIILPVFSKMQDNKAALQAIIIKIVGIVSLITIPFIAFSILFAQPILSTIYGPNYSAVSVPFSIMMIFVAIRFYSIILMQLYFALGRPDLHRNFALIRVLVGISLIYPAVKVMSLSGAALTVLISMFILFTLQLIWTKKLIEMRLDSFLKCLFNGLGLSTIVVLPGLAFKSIFGGKDILVVTIGVLLCLITWGIGFVANKFNMNSIPLRKFRLIKGR